MTQLAAESFEPSEWTELARIAATSPLDRERLADFDDLIPGPSLRRVDNIWGPVLPGSSSWSMATIGDVIRPLQYCATYLLDTKHDGEWLARSVVQNSGVHLEALMRRIVSMPWPLGHAIRAAIERHAVGDDAGSRLRRYAELYNAAKHRYDQPVNTHLFSVRDAILAYAVARKLGDAIHERAQLRDEWNRISRGDLNVPGSNPVR